jgi:hypothetical protein
MLGTAKMRTDIQDRFYRIYTYQSVDRVPDIEFGYWPQTIRRWLNEGMPLELTLEETTDMFSPKVDAHFGFEHEGHNLPSNYAMIPLFDEVVIEERETSVVMRDENGVIAERFLHDSDYSSIPHFIEFPIKAPDDWTEIKERYVLDDPARFLSEDEIAEARVAQAEGKAMRIFFVGFYGQLRNLMGTQNLSYAFFDYPEMIESIVEHWAELCARQIERLPSDIVIDQVNWWEDMAGKSGPLVGPTTFRRFLQPGYRRVMDAAKARGCVLGMVDSDGDPGAIVGNWMEEGVNIMFPLEVAAGVDPYIWREKFGMELRLRGGIGKQALVEGGQAITRELERIRPLFEQGGYIPHLDHLVPPDVPYDHYCEYLDAKRTFIGM